MRICSKKQCSQIDFFFIFLFLTLNLTHLTTEDIEACGIHMVKQHRHTWVFQKWGCVPGSVLLPSLSQAHSHWGSLWSWAEGCPVASQGCEPSYCLATVQIHLTPHQHKPSPSHTCVSWLPWKGKPGAETRWEGHAPAGHQHA